MKALNYAIVAIGAGSVLFQMVSVRYLFQTFNEQKVMHICIGLVLLSLVLIKEALEAKKRPRLSVILWSIPIIASLGILIYVKANYFDLIQKGDPEALDMAAGLAMIILCVGYTRKFFGYPLITIAVKGTEEESERPTVLLMRPGIDASDASRAMAGGAWASRHIFRHDR